MGDQAKIFLEAAKQEIEVTINIMQLLVIIGNIQIALKHPKNIGVSSTIVKLACIGFIDCILENFPEIWEHQDLIDEWEKDFDIKITLKGAEQNAGITSGDRDPESNEPG